MFELSICACAASLPPPVRGQEDPDLGIRLRDRSGRNHSALRGRTRADELPLAEGCWGAVRRGVAQASPWWVQVCTNQAAAPRHGRTASPGRLRGWAAWLRGYANLGPQSGVARCGADLGLEILTPDLCSALPPQQT